MLGELKESQEECEGIKKEQEDLLVLLADQDTKIANYKDRLRTLGEKVGFFLNFQSFNRSYYKMIFVGVDVSSGID